MRTNECRIISCMQMTGIFYNLASQVLNIRTSANAHSS